LLKEEQRRLRTREKDFVQDGAREHGISEVTTWMRCTVIVLTHPRIKTEQLGY
jgi:hypothetical protein